jgi:hypothetical protein
MTQNGKSKSEYIRLAQPLGWVRGIRITALERGDHIFKLLALGREAARMKQMSTEFLAGIMVENLCWLIYIDRFRIVSIVNEKKVSSCHSKLTDEAFLQEERRQHE